MNSHRSIQHFLFMSHINENLIIPSFNWTQIIQFDFHKKWEYFSSDLCVFCFLLWSHTNIFFPFFNTDLGLLGFRQNKCTLLLFLENVNNNHYTHTGWRKVPAPGKQVRSHNWLHGELQEPAWVCATHHGWCLRQSGRSARRKAWTYQEEWSVRVSERHPSQQLLQVMVVVVMIMAYFEQNLCFVVYIHTSDAVIPANMQAHTHIHVHEHTCIHTCMHACTQIINIFNQANEITINQSFNI